MLYNKQLRITSLEKEKNNYLEREIIFQVNTSPRRLPEDSAYLGKVILEKSHKSRYETYMSGLIFTWVILNYSRDYYYFHTYLLEIY